MSKDALANLLARCFLAGEPGLEAMVQRAVAALGRPWNWLWPVARNYFKAAEGKTRWRHGEAADFISRDRYFERAFEKYYGARRARSWITEPERMQPVSAAKAWDVPLIESTGALADWFWLELGQLEWLADLKGLGYKVANSKLRHYHYRILTKEGGSSRLIESPKPRLKEMQGQILEEILNRIPAHPAVHGFVRGRSILTFAAPHVGRDVVLRMDLKEFFPSFPAARVQALFRTVGYPEMVADSLGAICTSATPRDVWTQTGNALYSRRHLPQGAPTSPSIANLCAYRLDCRLAGLAKVAGVSYTRYADDMAFSGDEQFARGAERFSSHAAAILLEEGFAVNHRKTRIMRRGVRQQLAGLVVNEHTNVPRRDFDELKAILTNCMRLGAASQNRTGHAAFRAHLEGRVGFVEMVNAAKGARLRKLFERIDWK